MSRVKFAVVFFIAFYCIQSIACTTTQELRIENPNVTLQTLFYITHRKESVRMAIAVSPEDGKTVFTLMKCLEPKGFTIEDADQWKPSSCAPLSPLWLPLDETTDASNVVVNDLTTHIRGVLNEYIDRHGYGVIAENAFASFDVLMNGSVGLWLEFYTSQYAATSWFNRKMKWIARGTGWWLMYSTLSGGFFEFSKMLQDEERLTRVEEFTELVELMDRDAIFQFDGNDSSTQVYKSLSVVESAITQATVAMYEKYCPQPEGVANAN